LPKVIVQPQYIPSGIHSTTDIVPDETSNTPMQDPQLERQAQNPHRKASDMANKNIHNDEKLRIVYKSTAKTNMQKYAVGCMLSNHTN
jgi:hypothetical protein